MYCDHGEQSFKVCKEGRVIQGPFGGSLVVEKRDDRSPSVNELENGLSLRVELNEVEERSSYVIVPLGKRQGMSDGQPITMNFKVSGMTVRWVVRESD